MSGEQEILPPLNGPRLIALPHPITMEDRIDRVMPSGMTLYDIVKESGVHPSMVRFARVWVGDIEYSPETWKNTYPKDTSLVRVKVCVPEGGGGGGGGGKSVLRIVVVIIIIIVSIYTGGAAAGALSSSGYIGAAGTASYVAVSAGVGMAITMAGMAMLNALIPPAGLTDRGNWSSGSGTGGGLQTPMSSITGTSNRENPYGVQTRILGKVRLYPTLGAHQYTETIGGVQYLRFLADLGYGPLQIEDIKIGETPIAYFEGVQYAIRPGYLNDSPLSIYTQSVFQTSLNVLLTNAAPAIYTTHENTSSSSIDIVFGSGLTQYDDAGNIGFATVTFTVQYALTGTGTFSPVSWDASNTEEFQPGGNISVTRASRIAVLIGGSFTFPSPGQYDILVQRVSPQTTVPSLINDSTLAAYRSVQPSPPITKPGIATIEVRIQASNQLNGAIQSLNCVATSILRQWVPGTGWVLGPTRNPAWMYVEIMRGLSNKNPLADDSLLDLPKLVQWAAFCDQASPQGDAPMLTYNFAHNQRTTVLDALKTVCAAGRAAFDIVDGKFSVVLDINQVVPIQHFTPRNSANFSATKVFVQNPDGVRVRYINPGIGYLEDEIIVYSDGYTAGNASLFEQMDMLWCTNASQAYREARYAMAVAKLRPEIYTLQVDIENLVCRKGDLVYVTHDVTGWGLGFGRVKSVATDDSGNILSADVDDEVTFEVGKSYVMRFRRTSDGVSILVHLINLATTTTTVAFSSPLPPDQSVGKGDLFQFGLVNQETQPCLVKDIARGDDLSAKLVLIDQSPEIYSAYLGVLPDFKTNISTTTPPNIASPPPPQILSIDGGLSACAPLTNGIYQSRIVITMQAYPPSAIVIGGTEVQYRTTGTTAWFVLPPYPSSAVNLVVVPVTDNQNYDLRVRSISQKGIVSEWVSTSVFVTGLSSPIGDITSLSSVFVAGLTNLIWVGPYDFRHLDYEVRFGPIFSAARVIGRTPLSQCPAHGDGTYWVAAHFKTAASVDIYSAHPQSIIITGGQLTTNVIADFDEASLGWLGSKNGLTLVDGELMLDGSGDILLSSDVFSISDLISYGGYTSPGIYTVPSYHRIDVGRVSACGVVMSASVRGIGLYDDVTTILDILLVTDLTGLSYGPSVVALMQIRLSQDAVTWGPWQQWVPGSYSARVFDFSVTVTTLSQQIIPVLSDMTVAVDVPDFVVRYTGLDIPSGGLTVIYDAPFNGGPDSSPLPNIQVTILGASQGDDAIITSNTLSGFTIQVINSGIGVSRSINVVAQGY